LQGGTHDIVDPQPDAWSDAVVGFLRQPERTAGAPPGALPGALPGAG
jgi:hypothetical protein